LLEHHFFSFRLPNFGDAIDLALEVAEYFRISDEKATEIISIIQSEVSQWELISEKVGIPKAERNVMAKGSSINQISTTKSG
jgi:hypothetical protein